MWEEKCAVSRGGLAYLSLFLSVFCMAGMEMPLGQFWKSWVDDGRASSLSVPEILPAGSPPPSCCHQRERDKCLLCLSHYTEPRLSFTAVSLPYLIINVIRMSLYVSIKDRNSSFALKGKIPQNGQPQNSYDSLPSPPRRPSSEARCGCLPGAPVYL